MFFEIFSLLSDNLKYVDLGRHSVYNNQRKRLWPPLYRCESGQTRVVNGVSQTSCRPPSLLSWWRISTHYLITTDRVKPFHSTKVLRVRNYVPYLLMSEEFLDHIEGLREKPVVFESLKKCTYRFNVNLSLVYPS